MNRENLKARHIAASRFLPPLLLVALLFSSACHDPASQSDRDRAIALAIASGLHPPMPNTDVQAMVVPPVGWSAEPLKSSDQHAHQVWISPSRNTAYGVIYFSLPLPVGQDLALWGFLQQMKKTEGRANLISKEPDDQLPGLRFVAEGVLYTVRTNLIVSGFHGWAVYAGTINQKPVDDAELLTAIRAREQTHIGLP